MKIFCKTCKIQISKEITELKDLKMLNESDGEHFLPEGLYFISDGEYFTDSKNKIIINLKDSVNIKHHHDHRRLNGCCGLDGLDGLNVICKNGHEIGTEKSDCWMPYCIILEPALIIK